MLQLMVLLMTLSQLILMQTMQTITCIMCLSHATTEKNTRTQRLHIMLTTSKANDAGAAADDAAANVEHAADKDSNEIVVHAADTAVPLIANASRRQLHP